MFELVEKITKKTKANTNEKIGPAIDIINSLFGFKFSSDIPETPPKKNKVISSTFKFLLVQILYKLKLSTFTLLINNMTINIS